MDNLISYLSAHHFALMLVMAAAVLIAWFIFQKLMKLALLCLLVTLGIAGYFYLKQPGRTWKDVTDAWQKTRTQTTRIVETGKTTYQKGKEVYEEGRKFSATMDELMGKDKETGSERDVSKRIKTPD